MVGAAPVAVHHVARFVVAQCRPLAEPKGPVARVRQWRRVVEFAHSEQELGVFLAPS